MKTTIIAIAAALTSFAARAEGNTLGNLQQAYVLYGEDKVEEAKKAALNFVLAEVEQGVLRSVNMLDTKVYWKLADIGGENLFAAEKLEDGTFKVAEFKSKKAALDAVPGFHSGVIVEGYVVELPIPADKIEYNEKQEPIATTRKITRYRLKVSDFAIVGQFLSKQEFDVPSQEVTENTTGFNKQELKSIAMHVAALKKALPENEHVLALEEAYKPLADNSDPQTAKAYAFAFDVKRARKANKGAAPATTTTTPAETTEAEETTEA